MARLTWAALQRPGVRQFIKFCIIGLSNTFIDIGISWLLIFRLSISVILATVISWLVGVTNGYIWNSRWTFKGMGSGQRHELYIKFLIVNGVGLLLNLFIIKSVLFMFNDQPVTNSQPDRLHFLIAKVVAVGCVAVWNFMANKKWTFKNSGPPPHGQ